MVTHVIRARFQFAPFVIACFGILTPIQHATAHDFWIQPAKFICEKGTSVDIALRVGDEFPGEPVKRDSARIRRFVAIDAQGERSIGGKDGNDPAGAVVISCEGVTTIAYESHFKRIELEAAKFEEYLRGVGLDRVIDQRAKLKQTAAPGRESYGRCALSLIQAGSATAANGFRSPGLPLELQPVESDGTTNGGSYSFRLIFNKKPLAAALVSARRVTTMDVHDEKLRTDSNGVVRFKLDHPGRWILTNVHMVAVSDEPDVDWRSYWASLTFELTENSVSTSRPAAAESKSPLPHPPPASSQPGR